MLDLIKYPPLVFFPSPWEAYEQKSDVYASDCATFI